MVLFFFLFSRWHKSSQTATHRTCGKTTVSEGTVNKLLSNIQTTHRNSSFPPANFARNSANSFTADSSFPLFPKSKKTTGNHSACSVTMVRTLSLVGLPKAPRSSRSTGSPWMFKAPRLQVLPLAPQFLSELLDSCLMKLLLGSHKTFQKDVCNTPQFLEKVFFLISNIP